MNWKNLATATGPAGGIPSQVHAVITGDDQQRAEGINDLLVALVQPNQWFSASAPATEFIISSVAEDPAASPGAGRALWLALDIATAINEDFLRGIHFWSSSAEAEQCRAAVARAQPVLLRLLENDDPAVRAPAAALLALGEGDREAAARALRERRAVETDSFALAHLLLASGLLELFAGNLDSELAQQFEPFLSPEHGDEVRTCAALAHLACSHTLSPLAAEALPAAMQHNFTPTSVGWCDGRWPHLVAAVARRIGTHTAPIIAAALRDDLRRSSLFSPNQLRYWARVALYAAGLDADFDPWADVPLKDQEDFPPLQREIIAELAGFHIDFTGTGVPDKARARLRWLGLAPAGVLERPREWTIDGQKVCWPLWKIWKHEKSRLPNTVKGCLPPAMNDALTSDDRIECLLEACDFSYNLNRLWSPEEERLVLDRIVTADADDPLVQLAHSILLSHQNEPRKEPGFSDKLLKVWAAREKEWPPQWDWYIRWRNRGLLAVLPLARREARLFADPTTLGKGEAGAADVLGVLPLVPTRRATQWVLNEINERRRIVREKNWSEKSILELLQQVIDLARTEPEVQAALEEARRRDDWVPEETA